MSDDTARLIDEEVRDIIDAAHGKARDLLESNSQKLHLMAAALMKYETLDKQQIDQVMEGREPDPPEGWQDSDGEAASPQEEASSGSDRTSVGGPAEQV
jgi:cell division protease FtsH